MNTIEKKALHNVNEDLNLINPVMRPEEVRNGDPISCLLLENGTSRAVKIWSYCPFGFEFMDANEMPHPIGESRKFELMVGKTSIQVDGTIVFSNRKSEHSIIGVRIDYNNKKSESSGAEKRHHSRWNCPEHLLPSGTAANPVRYNDFILFKVIDVSSTGLKLSTSLRNKLLTVGQILECTLSVPMIGTLYTALRIIRVDIENVNGKEQLILGVSFVKNDDVVSLTLSEYLLTFAEGCTAKSLKDAGFKGILGTSKFDFSYAKSARDYDEILNLRFSSYAESGKLAEGIDKSFMQDEFDTRSRILIVKMNGKMVATIRGMFHEEGDNTSHERYLTYPENFPPINQSLEASRLCVDPDFQGAGLARELAKHLTLLTIKSGRKFIYLSAAGSFIDFWISLGYQYAGASYVHKQLGNLHHELVINNVYDSILARNVNYSTWMQTYSQLYDYCYDYGLIQPSPLDELKIWAYKTVGKLLKATRKRA